MKGEWLTCVWCLSVDLCVVLVSSDLMVLEVFCARVALLTLRAPVGFLSGVYPHVSDQLTASPEAPLALRAVVTSFCRVYACVALQLLCALEALLTLSAVMWLFSGVDSQVDFKSSWSYKALAALRAVIRPVVCVFARVFGQILLRSEAHVTVLALVGLVSGVNAHVSREPCFHTEGHPTL